MAVPESKRLLIVRSHFQSHPSAGPALRATEPLSPYRRVRGPLTPTISAPDFSSLPLNSSGHDFGGRWGGGCIRAVVNLCFTPAAQCGGVTVQAPLSLIYFRCFGACTRPALPCILDRSPWLSTENFQGVCERKGAF